LQVVGESESTQEVVCVGSGSRGGIAESRDRPERDKDIVELEGVQ
jgi:hypothetical protein